MSTRGKSRYNSEISRKRKDLMGSCATTGEGLFEGLQWLSQNVKGKGT